MDGVPSEQSPSPPPCEDTASASPIGTAASVPFVIEDRSAPDNRTALQHVRDLHEEGQLDDLASRAPGYGSTLRCSGYPYTCMMTPVPVLVFKIVHSPSLSLRDPYHKFVDARLRIFLLRLECRDAVVEAGLCSKHKAKTNTKPENIALLQGFLRSEYNATLLEDGLPFNAAMESLSTPPSAPARSSASSGPHRPRKRTCAACPIKDMWLSEGLLCPGTCTDRCSSNGHISRLCDGTLQRRVCRSNEKRHSALKGTFA
jgi:hypothetical protein